MPASPTLANTFESGQTAGTAISNANSGGAAGNAIDDISDISGAGSIVYDTAHAAHGSLAAKITTASGVGQYAYMRWAASYVTGGNVTEVWGRFYLYLTANVLGQITLVQTYASGGPSGLIVLGHVGTPTRLQVQDHANTNIGGTVDIPLNQWVRIEFHQINAASPGGLVEAKLFTTADSTTAAETVTLPSCDTSGAAFQIQFGVADLGGADPSKVIWMDDIQVNGTGYPGPVGGQTVAPISDVAAGSWTPSVSTSLFGTIDESPASDSDYDQSGLSPASADEMKVRLAPLVDPAVGTGHTVSYRYKKNATGGDRIDLTVKLYRADGTTVVGGGTPATWTHTNIDAVTTATQTLTNAQADDIPSADYATGLVLGFSAIKV